MARSILDLPPELLVHTLTLLPIRALLRFGQTSRQSHSLANSSLHTLSLGIHTTRLSGIISKLAATQYPQPKATPSAFTAPSHSSSPYPLPSISASTSNSLSRRSSLSTNLFTSSTLDTDPYRVSVLIPDAQTFDYPILLTFHTALTKSILSRHGNTLRQLDLSLWTLTIPLAKSLAALPALRTLSLRTQDYPHVRAIPTRLLGAQRTQECEAWEILAETAVWASRINALRVEGGELSTGQLARLLRDSRWCRELWLSKCTRIEDAVWGWLAGRWEGRDALRVLGVMRCGGRLSGEAVEGLGLLRGLQFLSLQGCQVGDVEAVEKSNREEWRIPEFLLPEPEVKEQDVSMVIEVDPTYMDDED